MNGTKLGILGIVHPQLETSLHPGKPASKRAASSANATFFRSFDLLFDDDFGAVRAGRSEM